MNKKTKILLAVTIVLVLFIAPFAPHQLDGLERVAHDLGFTDKELEPMYEIFPDYHIPLIENDWLGHALPGIVGLLLCLAVVWGYARIGTILRNVRKREQN